MTCDGIQEVHAVPGNMGDCCECSLELTLGYAEVPQQKAACYRHLHLSVCHCCVGTCSVGAGVADHHGQRCCRLHSSNDHCTEGGGEVQVVGGRMSAALGGEGQGQAPEVSPLAAATAYSCKHSALMPTCAPRVSACCTPPASPPYPLLAGFSLSAGRAALWEGVRP